jgi:hypothetical protein
MGHVTGHVTGYLQIEFKSDIIPLHSIFHTLVPVIPTGSRVDLLKETSIQSELDSNTEPVILSIISKEYRCPSVGSNLTLKSDSYQTDAISDRKGSSYGVQ